MMPCTSTLLTKPMAAALQPDGRSEEGVGRGVSLSKREGAPRRLQLRRDQASAGEPKESVVSSQGQGPAQKARAERTGAAPCHTRIEK